MNDEQKKDYTPTATNLARQLTLMTGIYWSPKMSENRGWGTAFSLIGANGMSMYVVNEFKGQGAKFSVHGEYPKWHDQEPYFSDTKPEIAMSQSKSIEQLALDIQRRFLPDYTELFNKMKARIALWEDSDNKECHAFLSMAVILDPAIDREKRFRELKAQKYGDRVARSVDADNNMEIEITRHGDELLQVEFFRLSLEETRQLVCFYKSSIHANREKPLQSSTAGN
jgi:hypothetical protein